MDRQYLNDLSCEIEDCENVFKITPFDINVLNLK